MVVFLLAMLLVLTISAVKLAKKQIGINKTINQLQNEKNELLDKQENLKASLSYLDTEDGKERAFREKYQLVKPGERLIVITNQENDVLEKENEKGSIFKSFVNIIKSVFSEN